MTVNVLIQARMGSTRLPGKVMADIFGMPMIELLIRRLQLSRSVNKIILATSISEKNNKLVAFVETLGVMVFRGSEDDVLDRFYLASQKFTADHFIRITADCPFIDPNMVDSVIDLHLNSGADYTSNTLPPSFPDGLDVEIFSSNALKFACDIAKDKFDREHVTPILRRSLKISRSNYKSDEDFSALRWTVDEKEDLDLIRLIYDGLGRVIDFSWADILKFVSDNPELDKINQMIVRNEGADMPTGQKLWKRAKKVIPGGNMLFSKRPELFLPSKWPAYFSKAKGCNVWDMDDNKYVDMSFMGIGTNILGYSNNEVDKAVISAASSGNMSTLNCPEEVYLAERLIDLHAWADMVKFARSGGEANAVAIRIARAASGKDNVAVCGYHGWHDWYLSANHSRNDELGELLMPGLEPNGVPKNLTGTVFPFRYNDYDHLETLIRSENIGVIKMEVIRNIEPEDHFLHKVRKLADDNGVVLIFDECTSGFRETFGGIHKKYDVEPDMAMFGKALGNGYAITCVIGKRSIMDAAQSSFISSTFWTEKIGPTAALKTLEVMERTESWKYITKIGGIFRKNINDLASGYDISITNIGIDPLVGYSFDSENGLAYKTFLSQEMLKLGYLAGTSTYICVDHSEKIIEGYFDRLDGVFSVISNCEKGNKDIFSLLESPLCHSSFERLN